MRFPENIERLVAGKAYREDTLGLSDARVLVFDAYALKIGKCRSKDAETIAVMRWLEGRLPVPGVVCREIEGDTQYLLMTRIGGRMACDPYWLERPRELTALLARAIRAMWAVDVSDCPRRRDLGAELAEARARVERGLVKIDRAEPETFGPGGFESPEALLDWLETHRPECDPAFSHGDFCLPNLFLEDVRISGFIDLDDADVSDRWRDVALCLRSLKHNLGGKYSGRAYGGFDPAALFDQLGVQPDWEKIRYYTLLDELF